MCFDWVELVFEMMCVLLIVVLVVGIGVVVLLWLMLSCVIGCLIVDVLVYFDVIFVGDLCWLIVVDWCDEMG